MEVITVAKHKTTSTGPARLVLDSTAQTILRQYVTTIRPQIGDGDTLLLLPDPAYGAVPVARIDPLMETLATRYNLEIPKATVLRKAISTLGAKKLDDPSVKLLSSHMSHSIDTHKKS